MAHLVGESVELVGEDGLHAVREGFVWLVMDFDEEAVGPNSDGGAGERKDFVTLAGAVAGIDENRQVAAPLDGGDDGEVESVSGDVGKGADPAVAKHYVVIALHEEYRPGQ